MRQLQKLSQVVEINESAQLMTFSELRKLFDRAERTLRSAQKNKQLPKAIVGLKGLHFFDKKAVGESYYYRRRFGDDLTELNKFGI